MGNSGIRKLFFQNNMVETKYKSLYEMKVESIDKEEISLEDLKGSYTLVVNCGSDNKEADKQFEQLRSISMK